MNFRLLLISTFLAAATARADPPSSAPPGGPAAAPPNSDSNPVVLTPVVVTDTLDQARGAILPELGATSFVMDQQQIQNLPQGADAPFSQVLLRAPGVAEDSSANGDLHVRGEHANLQYRINDVLLPEGLSGFGLELDPHFVNRLQLITGSLPAQYGFRTAGVVDITTKSGAMAEGGEASVEAGSFGTVRPSVEASGSQGSLSYFADGGFDHNDLGIENPTPSAAAVHDRTDQTKAFAYLSAVLSPTSRLSFIGSASDSDFQVPDTPGLPAGTAPDGLPWLAGSFDSARLNETQNEQNYYGVVAYQKSAGDLNYQLSAFGRASSVHFRPDPTGDLFFNGVASDVARRLESAGFQGDGSEALGSQQTLRAGVFLLRESVAANATTTVFPVDGAGDPTGAALAIADDQRLHGLFAGLYVQDAWKLAPALIFNFGARADSFDSSFDREGQVSPRANLVYQPSAATTIHAGYARYFTPPPVEDVPAAAVAKFAGTSNASPSAQDDPVRAERANYFDLGVSQQVTAGLQASVDGYYKRAANQLDDGLFGQTLILSAFNYAQGEIYGVELSSSYTRGAFSVYANLARSEAKGRDWDSAQFLFAPADLAYVRTHWIYLDHDQTLSGSVGTAYRWTEAHGSTRVYADALYGTGLRIDATAPDGSTIPNGGTVPAHATANLGVEQTFKRSADHLWKVRLDVINLADQSYELRDGTGVGVNAAQYGMRRATYGAVSYAY
jgi:outer membrane receptor protein involved in Fe transport